MMKEDIKKLPPLLWLKQTMDRHRALRKNRINNLMLGTGNRLTEVTFGQSNLLTSNIRMSHCTMGDYSYVNNNSVICRADIGKFTCIGENVLVGLGIHPTDTVSIHPAFYTNKKSYYFADKNYFDEYATVHIGNDAWLGSNCVVLDGVTIGDGAIVAAGAVVSKDVSPYSIVGGVPAKHIKLRFSPETVEKLLGIKWWNWPLDKIKKNKLLFLDTEEFLKHFT